MTGEEMAKALGVDWPAAHPMTGEPFTDGNIEQEHEPTILRYGPPLRPGREVYEDVECPCCGEYVGRRRVRSMTDDEYAAALAAHEKAMAEWERTGGQAYRDGPVTTRGTFTTDSGAEADGRWTGSEWLWQGASVAQKAQMGSG